MKSISLPPNVEELGQGSLGQCSSLTAIDMSSLVRLKELPDDILSGCARLATIRLPPNLEYLDYCVFEGLINVRELPEYFMSGCTSLSSIQFPPNVESFGAGTLDCASLTTIDTGLTAIDMSL